MGRCLRQSLVRRVASLCSGPDDLARDQEHWLHGRESSLRCRHYRFIDRQSLRLPNTRIRGRTGRGRTARAPTPGRAPQALRNGLPVTWPSGRPSCASRLEADADRARSRRQHAVRPPARIHLMDVGGHAPNWRLQHRHTGVTAAHDGMHRRRRTRPCAWTTCPTGNRHSRATSGLCAPAWRAIR